MRDKSSDAGGVFSRLRLTCQKIVFEELMIDIDLAHARPNQKVASHMRYVRDRQSAEIWERSHSRVGRRSLLF